MYFSTPEQFISTQSANVAATYSLVQQLFNSFEELTRLNLQTTKTAFAESGQTWQMGLSGKTPVELFVYQAGNARSAAEKVLTYNGQILEMARSAQAEWLKLFEDRCAQSNETMQTAFERFSHNAPAGSELAVNAFKSAIFSAGSAYDAMRKATAQAVALAQAGQPPMPASTQTK